LGLDDIKSGELLFFRTGEAGAYEAAPVLASDVHLEIAGIVARGRVTQISSTRRRSGWKQPCRRAWGS
jgi:hypothetical protein